MISFLRRNRQPLIISLVLVFVISIFVGLGGYYLTGADVSEAVAVVDGVKIPYLRYRARVDSYLEMVRSQGQEVTKEIETKVKTEMLREMIVDEILSRRAEEMGMHVSDHELALAIQQTPTFQQDGRFIQQLYFRAVRLQFKTTPEQYERARRRSMLASRLKALMFRAAKIAPSEGEVEYQAYLRQHKKTVKDPKKDPALKEDEFLQQQRQRRAVETVNFYLRQIASQADIRSYLDQRERGL